MFGPHLMMDCYDCDKQKLLDAKLVLDFLEKLPNELGMHIVHGPHILKYPENPNTWDKGGVSAFVIIAESHISIHTFPHPHGYMNIDVFSCKHFDVEKAIQRISETFGAKKVHKKLIMRGREFPKELIQVTPIIEKQRDEAAAVEQ